MRSGDVVRDGQGNTYQVGQLLGRGLWGSSFLVRRESSDTLHVLKCPLGPEDFRSEVPGSDALFAATREAVLEQARLYEQGQFAFLPRMEARFTLPDGQPAYILPRFADSLERRLVDGLPLSTLLDVLIRVGQQARQLSAGPGLHGNIRASNIFFSERGEIFLTDVATPAVRKALGRMLAIQNGARHLPPELLEGQAEAPWNAGVDTYALSALLLAGLLTGEPLPALAREGLTKQTAIHIKNRVTEKLKQEESNPRFHQRTSDRSAAMISRALSREHSPSPPYRFNRMEELLVRMEELKELVHPRIHTIGKVMLDRGPTQSFFTTDETVSFSCTVGCSAGVEGQEEIGVGLAVFDLDRDERVKNLEMNYRIDKHPSGRFRFQFGITGLSPGRYRTRMAYTIRDANDAPSTTEVEYLVRPTAGWTPPADAPNPGVPLAFPEIRPERTDTDIPTNGGTVVPLAPSRPEPLRPEPKPKPRPEPLRAEPPRQEAQPIAPPPKPKPRAETPALRLDLNAVRPEAPRPRPKPPRPETPRAEVSRPEFRTDAEVTRPSIRLDAPKPELPRPEPARTDPRVPPARTEGPRNSRPPQRAPSREDTPAVPKRSWTQEPLPPARNERMDLDDETTSHGPEEEEVEESESLMDRVLNVFRNDPYTLVMSVIAVLIVVMLLTLLFIRK